MKNAEIFIYFFILLVRPSKGGGGLRNTFFLNSSIGDLTWDMNDITALIIKNALL